MPSFSFLLLLPLASPKVFRSKIRTSQDHHKCLSKYPPNILPGSHYTLFSLSFTSGECPSSIWRMFLPEQLQAWPIQWAQFLSISSCHFCSGQGPGRYRSSTGWPSKANGWSFSYSIISTLPKKSQRALVMLGGVDKSFKALGSLKHYAHTVHSNLFMLLNHMCQEISALWLSPWPDLRGIALGLIVIKSFTPQDLFVFQGTLFLWWCLLVTSVK